MTVSSMMPAMENLLLSSSSEVDVVDPHVARIPVQPSRGNFYEAGFSKGISGKMRSNASFYRRTFNNYADDDVFLNTGVINFAGLFSDTAIARRAASTQGSDTSSEHMLKQ
jgi:hypothetical protein